ncbi:MAG: polysaccharide pyruvyl transferase family protein [Treponema sp.]|jgi:polysaccharide pyruvyl transferase WcaK-like protein|nr:polysaccharide pyruvyl transferase family protein [Treponema sp.]
MKKILLYYAFSGKKNAGDLAMTLGAIDLLLRKEIELTVVSRHANDSYFRESSAYLKKLYPLIKVLPCPFEFDRNASRLTIVMRYFSGLLKLMGIMPEPVLRKQIKYFDAVYFNGGNSLHCTTVTDFIRMTALLYPLRLAKKAKVPFVILPQSTTEFNWLGRRTIKPVLNAAEKVYCREALSYDVFKQYFPKSSIFLNTDLVFFMRPVAYTQRIITRKVAVTIRASTIGDYYDLPDIKIKQIEAVLLAITGMLLKNNYKIIFVVQTEKDTLSTKRVQEYFSDTENVLFYESNDPLALRNFYRTCDLLIGMRLHSILLALSAGTSCIGYFDKTWGLKGPGILSDYKQDYVFIGEEEKLLELVKKNLDRRLDNNEKDIFLKIEKYTSEMFFE